MPCGERPCRGQGKGVRNRAGLWRKGDEQKCGRKNEKWNHLPLECKYKEKDTDCDSHLSLSAFFLMLQISFSMSTPIPPLSKSICNLFSESVTLSSLKFMGICNFNPISNAASEEQLQYFIFKSHIVRQTLWEYVVLTDLSLHLVILKPLS